MFTEFRSGCSSAAWGGRTTVSRPAATAMNRVRHPGAGLLSSASSGEPGRN